MLVPFFSFLRSTVAIKVSLNATHYVHHTLRDILSCSQTSFAQTVQ